MSDEFYVGYLPAAPDGVARRVRAAVVVLAVVAVAIAALLASAQRPFGPGRFEFGTTRELTGIVREGGQPLLLVPDADGVSWRTWLLSAFGKHGAHELVRGHDGEVVRLRGTLIERDGRPMLEVEAGSVEPLGGPEATALRIRPRPDAVPLGRFELVGEIVDSKCFLGVMKPGNLKPHRSCATRCISGGVPPVLLVRSADGSATSYLLTGPGGAAINRDVLEFVAEPVAIAGEVERLGDLLVLRADPGEIRRLPSR